MVLKGMFSFLKKKVKNNSENISLVEPFHDPSSFPCYRALFLFGVGRSAIRDFKCVRMHQNLQVGTKNMPEITIANHSLLLAK